MAYDHYNIWGEISKNKEVTRNLGITSSLKIQVGPTVLKVLSSRFHHSPPFAFLLFLSVMLLPTVLSVGAKHLSEQGGSCVLFFSLISQAKKFARLLKSSCALSVTRTAHYRDSTIAVSMPRWVCSFTFSSLRSTFSKKHVVVRIPPANCFLSKLNIPKSFNNQYHWQWNKMSLCSNYKTSVFLCEYHSLPLFLKLIIVIIDTNFHLEWCLYYF